MVNGKPVTPSEVVVTLEEGEGLGISPVAEDFAAAAASRGRPSLDSALGDGPREGTPQTAALDAAHITGTPSNEESEQRSPLTDAAPAAQQQRFY